jgi:hypothetical protein
MNPKNNDWFKCNMLRNFNKAFYNFTLHFPTEAHTQMIFEFLDGTTFRCILRALNIFMVKIPHHSVKGPYVNTVIKKRR